MGSRNAWVAAEVGAVDIDIARSLIDGGTWDDQSARSGSERGRASETKHDAVGGTGVAETMGSSREG